MNESDFLSLTDTIFDRIEQALDDSDIDSLRAGNVLELECEDGSKVIVNRHAANQEIWIAAKAGGYHYRFDGQNWVSTREAGEFFADLARLLSAQAGADISI